MLIYWNHVRKPSMFSSASFDIFDWSFHHLSCTCCGRAAKRTTSLLESCPSEAGYIDFEYRALHPVALQWVNKAPGNNHSSDAFRSMLTKPRKTKDFHAAVQQVSIRACACL